MQLNRFKSPLELEKGKGNRTKKRVAKISKIHSRGGECVLKCASDRIDIKAKKTFCFLHSNANCIFRPVVRFGEAKNRIELRSEASVLSWIFGQTHTVHLRQSLQFSKFFFSSDYLFRAPTKPPINNFKTWVLLSAISYIFQFYFQSWNKKQ